MVRQTPDGPCMTYTDQARGAPDMGGEWCGLSFQSHGGFVLNPWIHQKGLTSVDRWGELDTTETGLHDSLTWERTSRTHESTPTGQNKPTPIGVCSPPSPRGPN